MQPKDYPNRVNIREVGAVGSDSVVYEDLQTSGLSLRVGGTAPTERLYNFGVAAGVTFPVLGFALNNFAYFVVQSQHSMKLNTPLCVHLHYTLPNTTTIGNKFKFQLDVVAASYNGVYAKPTGSPFSAEATVATADNTSMRILSLPDVPAVNTTVSTLYYCKLTRIAASAGEYAGEVYVSFVDCHYQKDTTGSLSEATKI